MTHGMDRLRREMTDFFQKLYVEEQKILVFGEGKCPSRVALIGEAPGEQETLQGRPFVGKAGKTLDEFLYIGRQVLDQMKPVTYLLGLGAGG